MMQFLKKNPYILVYSVVILFASFLFGAGKLFRGLEWYLDKSGLVMALLFSMIGIALSAALLYFRQHPDNTPHK